jgi:hypothetical protein
LRCSCTISWARCISGSSTAFTPLASTNLAHVMVPGALLWRSSRVSDLIAWPHLNRPRPLRAMNGRGPVSSCTSISSPWGRILRVGHRIHPTRRSSVGAGWDFDQFDPSAHTSSPFSPPSNGQTGQTRSSRGKSTVPLRTRTLPAHVQGHVASVGRFPRSVE